MPISPGDKLPAFTFRTPGTDGPKDIATDAVFAGKKAVLFAVPGAFTPTCHMNHLPGFLKNAAAFKAKGVETIAVTAVNDVHVMKAWAEATGSKDAILHLADGSAHFAKAIGLELDAGAFGMGMRSKRYAMLVEDGVVKILHVEDSPGKAEASSAEALLDEM
jgi:glutaredoxin/glutathione-dependent peroxiredoxin